MSRETTAELRADLRTGIDSIEDNREEARAIDLVEKKEMTISTDLLKE